MKAFLYFLLSLKTAFGIFLFAIGIGLVGSFMLPYNLSFFSGIDDTMLIQEVDCFVKKAIENSTL